MVGFRALNHMTCPSNTRGNMQHSHAHGAFLVLSSHGLHLSLLLFFLDCTLPSLPRGVLRSCGTFRFFSIVFFLTAWACLLLGILLSRHLGLGGDFSVVPQEGLPELLGIRMLLPVFLRRAHCSLRLARRLIGFNTW